MFYFYRNLLIASVAFVFLATAVSPAPVEGILVFSIFSQLILKIEYKKIKLFQTVIPNLSFQIKNQRKMILKQRRARKSSQRKKRVGNKDPLSL